MRLNLLLSLLTTVVLAASASANDAPSSLLLFPEFNSGPGYLTLITVVNTNGTQTTPLNSTQIDAHFVYVNGETCLEFDRTEHLTPNDLVTVIARNHNPNAQMGYLFVEAMSSTTGRAVKWNYLVGSQMQLNSFEQFNYSYTPIGFQAVVAGADGTPTDLDNDGFRDLNGLEYEKAWNEVLIPNFLGQAGPRVSNLVLLNLNPIQGTNGILTSTVDFLVYDDAENQYSASTNIRCWQKTTLLSINGVFANDWLAQNGGTGTIPGAVGLETGWFRVRGASNAAIIAVLDENIGSYGMADLPYFVDQTNVNGRL
jgi:hypothetical protein